jgi:CRISPR-associated exonuclease Cas4
MYDEDDLLALSGIQHIAFCERQWALIHIEKQWAENVRTIQGRQLHNKVDNPYIFESRVGIVTARAVPIVSYKLGLYGVADVVEFRRDESPCNAVALPGKSGFWSPYPVEYKRGREKKDDRDEVQLCAQAICLEEMLDVSIENAYLYYGETRHRVQVKLTETLRQRVTELSQRMHWLFDHGITPKANVRKNCKLCSLLDICLPKAGSIKAHRVEDYLKDSMEI